MPRIDWIKNRLFGAARRNGTKHHQSRSRRRSTLLALVELENRTLPSLAVTSLFTNSSPVTVTLGQQAETLTDWATLYGGKNPTGTITFTLISLPSDALLDTESVSVHGDGTYTTPHGYTLPTNQTVTGTYEWGAHYSGDPNNDAAEGNSGNYGQDASGDNPNLQILVSFNGSNGANPFSGVIRGSNGNIYGVTAGGGAYGDGTVYELILPGVSFGGNFLKVVASFDGSNGATPLGSLISDSQGNLFGTTQGGGEYGDGTIFEVAAGSDQITTLASFNGNDGADCQYGLVEDSLGDLFGTTVGGGPSGDGTVFELAAGSHTIHDIIGFNSFGGLKPEGGLVEDASGDLFGTTSTYTNFSSGGSVFEVKPSGASNTLVTFPFSLLSAAPQQPSGTLILDSNGDLLGTTSFGGADAAGAVFEVAAGTNQLTTLASFSACCFTGGASGLVEDGKGDLFGMTAYDGSAGLGTVYEVVAGSGTVTALATFDMSTGGEYSPIVEPALLEDNNGDLFGTTYDFGPGGDGTIFELQPVQEYTTVNQAQPTLTNAPVAPSTALGPPPLSLKDSATLSGAYYPGGTMTFTLFRNATQLDQETVSVTGDGTYTTPKGFTVPAYGASLGTYTWIASYSGDTNNAARTTEALATVTPANPTIVTAPSPTAIILGTFPPTITDTATIANGYNPTGTLTFKLYLGGILEKTEQVAVNGNGVYAAPGYALPTNQTVTGTYRWDASYSGDSLNNPATDNGNPNERATVSSASPTMVTTPSSGNVSLGTSELTLKDTATLSGGYHPTGTIEFTLYVRGDLTPVHTESVAVNGNRSYTTTLGYPVPTTSVAAGVYQWYAVYSGDGNNNGCSSRAVGGLEALASFPAGKLPYAYGSVVVDKNGDVFGTTSQGGADHMGTVYEVAAGSGSVTTLVTFTGANGGYPSSGLIEDSQGNLFGTTGVTGLGGAEGLGTIYEIQAGTHRLVTLASFTGGYNGLGPAGNLYEDSRGDLFGITVGGGVGSGVGDGIVYELASGSHTITELAAFTQAGADQDIPFPESQAGGLVEDSRGDLFGTLPHEGPTYGGTDFLGSVFEIAAGTHTITTVAAFNGVTNGAYPDSPLLIDSKGDLFGTTANAGTVSSSPYAQLGTVYEIAAGSHTITTLAAFPQPTANSYIAEEGEEPIGNLVVDKAGNVFGTTISGGSPDNGGVVFEIAAGSGTITDLDSFDGVDGGYPYSGVFEDSQGNLYGTTIAGGSNGTGVVFEVPAAEQTVINAATPVVSSTPNPTSVTLGTTAPTLTDSATLSNGYNPTGTLTFSLYLGSTLIKSENLPASGDGTYVAPGVTLGATGAVTGTYQWDVSYSGDANNKSASDINDPLERVRVFPATPTITTSPNPSEFALGNFGRLTRTLTDSANLSGGYHPTGTITFALYFNGNLVNSEQAVVNGNGAYLTPTGYALSASGAVAGTYEWAATYSGDANNNVASPSGVSSIATASFSGGGPAPYASLIEDSHGDLFGTTINGGVGGEGSVYEIAPGSGAIVTLASFNGDDGLNPYSGVIEDSRGDLFGTAESGGAEDDGVVYEVPAGSGVIIDIASFNGTDGAYPEAGLIQDKAGDLFGTALNGGAYGDGDVFEIPAGSNSITDITSFDGSDGESPFGGVVEDRSGDLFGTTALGGALGVGTVYEVAAGRRTVTDLASFDVGDGFDPMSGVVLDSRGDLFGTATLGGQYDGGAVYEVKAGSSTITDVVSFQSSGGWVPIGGLVEDSAGNLFGTTESGGADNGGSVYEVVAGSDSLTELDEFDGSHGANPEATLLLDSHGSLIGTTTNGGANDDGTLFEIAPPELEQVVVSPASPTLTTTPSPGAVTLGASPTTLNDTAVLAGAFHPTGTITFTLYAPDDPTPVDTEGVKVNGDGTYSTPVGYTLPATGAVTGVYEWTATYGGDVNNLPATPNQGSPQLISLASFDGSDGAEPEGGVIEDARGDFFGVTFEGGADNDGTVYEIAAGSSAITTLASFDGSDGQNPESGLIEDSAGDLFGTADGGSNGDGVVFEVAAGRNTITDLASFTGANGSFPVGLIEDSQGDLLGTTQQGGANNEGTVFELASGSDTITTLASFDGSDGTYPESGVIEDREGNLFGATTFGGANNDGTVYEIAAGSRTITDLASFNGDLTYDGQGYTGPAGGLIEDASGDLFGTTSLGGADADGTVFEVVAGSGAVTTLATFDGTNGSIPESGVLEDSQGNLFGTTSNGGPDSHGSVFELAAGTITITTLANFNGSNGTAPDANVDGDLLEDNRGDFFGTTFDGGSDLDGTVFELTTALALEPVTVSAAIPTISTTPEPAAVTLSPAATTLKDTATLSGGYNPTGTITFTLYAPNNPIAVEEETVAVNGNGIYVTPTGYTLPSRGPVTGTYQWDASYSGDANNQAIPPQTTMTLDTLASFSGSDGSATQSGLVEDRAGDLFGAAPGGGASGYGAVYEVAAGSGAITDLASFESGSFSNPIGNLVEDSRGDLFGSANRGGASGDGVVYELAAGSSTLTVVASFNGTNGSYGGVQEARLVIDSQGDLYGTTYAGGAHNDGTVFEIVAGSGVITTLASFNGSDGQAPNGGLILDQSGDLLGTTFLGGANYDGTVFEIAAGSGTITTLASFSGGLFTGPTGALATDSSGNLFGTTLSGGANGDGTIYEVAAGSGAVTTLATFDGSNGNDPEGGVAVDSRGDLFGATVYGGANNDGTVFELAAGSSTIATLITFNGSNGANPLRSLTADGNGDFFGTTWTDGSNGYGTVFEVTPTLGLEQVTVSASSPSLVSVPGGSVVLGSGTNLTDSVTLSGAYNPSGTITFTLYDPTGTVVDIESVAVKGNGTYTTPNGYLPTIPGTYHWVVTYGGDEDNSFVVAGTAAEQVVES